MKKEPASKNHVRFVPSFHDSSIPPGSSKVHWIQFAMGFRKEKDDRSTNFQIPPEAGQGLAPQHGLFRAISLIR
jgi:hypothetical protein